MKKIFFCCICIIIYSVYAQDLELSPFHEWLYDVVMPDQGASLLSQVAIRWESEIKRVEEKTKSLNILKQENEQRIKTIDERIKEFEEKIKKLGSLERDEFETKQHFLARMRKYNDYQAEINELKKSKNEIDSIRYDNLPMPNKVAINTHPIKGYVTIQKGDIALGRFDIDRLCFPCLVEKSSYSSFFRFNFYNYENYDKRWVFTVCYDSPDINESDPNIILQKIKTYDHIFDLFFASPEEARSFKVKFESGEIKLLIPVDILFSYGQETESVLVSPKETETDSIAVAQNIATAALYFGMGLLAEACNPGSGEYVTRDMEDFFVSTERVKKKAEYRTINVFWLKGVFNSFPKKIKFSDISIK